MSENGLGLFFSYSEPDEDLNTTIEVGILDFIVTEFLEKDFNRSDGAGVEYLENASSDALGLLLARARIVEAVGRYNETVPTDKKVITSQNWINIITVDNAKHASQYNVKIGEAIILIRVISQSALEGITNPLILDMAIPFQPVI